jgi:sarcosine oxidase
MPAYDVAIVGLGAMGSAALYHLARRGVRVVGLERVAPSHAGGSSHGESRIIRMTYFEHESYVHLLRRAYENWRQLERHIGKSLLTITGILEAGHPDSEAVRGSRESSAKHDLDQEELTAAQVSKKFPAFTLPRSWQALYQRDGGILRPELATMAHVEAARASGADIRNVGIRRVGPLGDAVRLTADDGATVDAGAVIVTAGAWIAELVPELRPHLCLTRQVMVWFEPRAPKLVTPPQLPVFVLDTGEDLVYGFPDFAGSGVKAASHRAGRTLARADDARQDAESADAQPVRETLERFVPAAAGAVRDMKTCIYTRIRTRRPDGSEDTDFIVDRHPAHAQIVLASPCSGHGFKFASVIGEILADLATTGTTKYDLSRFRLARFAQRGET